MDYKDLRERDRFIDLESGFVGNGGSITATGEEPGCSDYHYYHYLESHEPNGEDLLEEKLGLLKKMVGPKKLKKKGTKKPPKPPRPPKSPSLDAADLKLIREISEISMLKQARVERMKALKKMKNTKGTSASSNLCALVITVVFCILIIWQGVFSRGSSNVTSQRSSTRYKGGFISVQLYKDASTYGPRGSDSSSLKNVEQVSGLDEQRGKHDG